MQAKRVKTLAIISQDGSFPCAEYLPSLQEAPGLASHIVKRYPNNRDTSGPSAHPLGHG